jgi:hypothetical protein
MKKGRIIMLALFCHLLPARVSAADLFDVGIDVTGFAPLKIATANIADMGDYFKDSEIAKRVPGYTGTEPVAVTVAYPGLHLEYRYAQANSTQLTLKIPEFGIDKTFTGATRTDSRHLAMAYLKAGGYQTKLAELLISKATALTAATTATDPVAGNPQSLLASMVRNDFEQQFMGRVDPREIAGNGFGVGYRYGTMMEGARKGNVHALTPYHRWKMSPRVGEELTLSVPLAVTRLNATDAYQVGAALAYRLPVLSYWTVSASGSAAVVGSAELVRLSKYGGISMASDLHWDLAGGWRVAIGNMVGNYRTFEIRGVNPELHNTVFSNALVASRPLEILGDPVRIDYSLVETRYSGSSLHVPRSWEVGVAATQLRAGQQWRIAASFLSAAGSGGGYIGLTLGF